MAKPSIVAKNCFYENIKDEYPHNPRVEHDGDDEAERYVYVYNEEIGRREGRFCTPEELKDVMV